MWGWTMLGAFVLGWVVCTVVAFRRKASATVAIGGGFIVGILAVLPVAGIQYLATQAASIQNVPEHFEQTNLLGRQWRPEEFPTAARLTANLVQEVLPLLEKANEMHDQATSLPVLDLALPVMQTWNDQQNEKLLVNYRPCQLAAVSLGDAAALRAGSLDELQSRLRYCRSTY